MPSTCSSITQRGGIIGHSIHPSLLCVETASTMDNRTMTTTTTMPTRATALVLLLVLAVSSVQVQSFTGPLAPTNSITNSLTNSIKLFSAPTINGNAPVTTNGDSDNDSSSPNIIINRLEDIRLNVYEKARTVTSCCTSGTLCTMSAHEGIQGAPFGSFVDYVLDDEGNPVLLMNDMSMHTINIQKASEEAKASSDNSAGTLVTLFTQLGGGVKPDPAVKGLQDVSRCSITGHLVMMDMDNSDMDIIRMRYSLAHAYADQVMDSPRFSFYRLLPRKIYFVGGFGVLAKWVDPEDYRKAAPDILANEAAIIVERINFHHEQDLLLTAQHLLDVPSQIEQIRVTNVDRLGMDIRVTSQKGTRRNKLQTDEFRIGFRIPVISVEDAKSEILKVFQEAWEKGTLRYC
jgi:putative heme iron utilization protein